jgi:hypothetical protein
LAIKGQSLTVGILISDKVEVLDAAGPFEVFSATRLDERLRQVDDHHFGCF